MTTAISLFGCFVCAVATFSWFQLDQQPIKSSLVSSSPNLTVDNSKVYGYKINQGIGDNGFVNYDSDDAAKFAGTGIAGTNHHQDSSDINFDVPSEGIGYYLVKKNPGGTFKYKYTNDGINYTSYSSKFKEYASPTTRARVNSITVEANDVFRVMHYTFNNSKTVNRQVTISSTYPASGTSYLTIDSKTSDVKVTTAGTYNVWLDTNTNCLSFEKKTITSGGINIRSLASNSFGVESPSRKLAAGSTNNVTAPNINLWCKDEVGWTGYGTCLVVRFNSVVMKDECAYATLDAALAVDTGTGISKSNGDYWVDMTWSGSDGQSYYWTAPWYIKSINYTYSLSNNLSYKPGGYNGSNNGKWGAASCSYTTSHYREDYICDGGKNCSNGYSGSTAGSKNSNYYVTTTYTIAFNRNGASTTNPSDQTVYKYGKITQPSTPTKANCTFKHWSSGGSTGSAYSFGSAVTSYFTLTAVWEGTVSIVASYFINGTKSSFTEELKSTTITCGTTYTASLDSSYNNRVYKDTANGVYYYATRDSSSNWYNEAACTTKWTNSSTINANKTIYVKYNVMVSSGYKTLYVDIKNAYHWYNDTQYFWGNVSVRGTSSPYDEFINCVQVANDLWRFTIPGNYSIRLGKTTSFGSSTQHDRSTQTDISSATDNETIIHINNCNPGSEHGMNWCNYASTANYGTAIIYTSNNYNSGWTEVASMDTGDGSSNNYFIYEHGLRIASGKYIKVEVTGSTITGLPGGDLNGTYNTSLRYYTPGDTPYITATAEYLKTDKYSDNARFNFYVTNNGYLSIAMVPDLGNGFYVMEYNSTYGTNNYIGSIKMTTNSNVKATYEGFYATAGYECYIRTYLDAVDNLISKSKVLPAGVYLGTSDGSTATATGVLHFTNAGYYTIVVENGQISVSSYSIDASFKLNRLNTDEASSACYIWKQKTSLVLEIPFTCVNSYTSSISLVVSNSLSRFVGVSLYVSDHQIDADSTEATDPYHFMRGKNATYLTRSTYYNSLSNASTITDLAGASVKSTDAEDYYYAYILIDYLPTYTNTAGYTHNSADVLAGNTAYAGSKTNATTTYTSSSANDFLNVYV